MVKAKAEVKPKTKQGYTAPPAGPSKRFKEAVGKIEEKPYDASEAIELVKKLANAKFDETIELHIRLGIDPKQTAQQVRGSVKLPHGTGKRVRILVFAEGDAASQAQKLGATVATDEIISQIEKGSIHYDVVIATPSQMPKIAKLARVLGVRGLMPNPKSGTVTDNIAEVIEERTGGLVDFKNSDSLLHLGFGKASFDAVKLKDNLVSLHQAITSVKPAKLSGDYFRSIHISSTMGPGIKVDPTTIK